MADLGRLLRHGDTTWTEHEQHTGRQDLPLSAGGRAQAYRAGQRLAVLRFASVLVSPQRRVIAECRTLPGPAMIVGHGKMLRALAARWIGQPVAVGACLPMDPAAISVLELERGAPLLRLWNYTGAL